MTDDRPPTVVVQPSQGVVGVAADTVGALRGSPMLLVMVGLAGCSASFEFGRPKIVEEGPPAAPAIESVITGMREAQELRTLTRQLAR